jgi:hypothetical protein
MSVEQLEEGVMGLWQDTWNAEAFSRRKRHYRDLLRSRPGRPTHETEEYFALPTAC